MKNISTFALVISILLTGCTDNQMAKKFGGTITLNKPNPDYVLENITWKGEQLWVLWYDPKTNTCHFNENSNFGIIEGKIVTPNCK